MHLLDGIIAGVLLKELFQRDGVGTMVARYQYLSMLTRLYETIFDIVNVVDKRNTKLLEEKLPQERSTGNSCYSKAVQLNNDLKDV